MRMWDFGVLKKPEFIMIRVFALHVVVSMLEMGEVKLFRMVKKCRAKSARCISINSLLLDGGQKASSVGKFCS